MTHVVMKVNKVYHSSNWKSMHDISFHDMSWRNRNFLDASPDTNGKTSKHKFIQITYANPITGSLFEISLA